MQEIGFSVPVSNCKLQPKQRFLNGIINGGEFKSIRLAGGASTFPLALDGPGAPVGGESWGVGALPPADTWEDGAGSVGATESDKPPALSGLFLQFAASLRIV